eukprot:scaffold9846_cov36-Cyclotella_meneghiniana.AAC.1
MASATYPLAEKFGVARQEIVTTAKEGDETKNRFVQQVLVGLAHRVKEGHERAKKYDFMAICNVADYTGNTSSQDCVLPGGVIVKSTFGRIGSRSPRLVLVPGSCPSTCASLVVISPPAYG